MSFPKQIFRTYDIRGIYGKELTEDVAYRTGRAFAEFIKKDISSNKAKIVVARDMRDSSPSLQGSVIKGITEQGVDVVDIGLASTPTFYWAVAKYNYDGGLIVSASHNPKEYNGIKLTKARAVAISGETGILDIRDMAEKNEFVKAETPGKIIKKDKVLDEQINEAWDFVDKSKIKPLKVVVDTANAMCGLMVEKIFAGLPCELIKMYFELDGSFPNHEADPFKEENNRALQAKVVEVGADLGITTDGDADRVFFIDETGRTIEPAIVRGILAQAFLREYPGAKICYDIRPGKITEDMILEAGGVPIITRVGHSLIKAKALEEGAVFAGESSGHYYVKSDIGFFERTEIIILKFLQEISLSGKIVSEFIKPLQKYFHSGEINFDVEDKQAVFDRLKTKYGDNLKYDIDGLSFEFEDFWFNVRASNTESVVRLNLEAVSEVVMQTETEKLKKIIIW